MSKKKISLIIATGVLVTALVGGSLAWFTSKEEVTNKFATGSIKHRIIENFEEVGAAEEFLPGDEVNKDVCIENTGKSDALLRVRIKPEWKDNENNVLKSEFIKLIFSEDVDLDISNGIDERATWVKGNDDYLYYIKIFEAGAPTEKLLDAVSLSGEADNSYAEKAINVIIESETVQVNKDAYRDEWKISSTSEGENISTPEEEIINILDNLVEEYKANNSKKHGAE